MDQMFFSFKRAHHACLRFMRPMLAQFGLTPARVDLMTALKLDRTQTGVTKLLGLARATVSEMLARLEELGLITRWRYRRTKLIFLTKKGQEALQAAIDVGVNTGFVPLSVDAVLTARNPEIDPLPRRFEVEGLCIAVRRAFGDFAGPDLYFGWHPDEWLGAILDPDDPEDLARFAPQS